MDTVARDELRAVISGLVARVRPLDKREAADQAGILAWIGSGEPVFRTAPPATPPRHLVSYFALIDDARGLVLLGDHVKSGLWLPSGGHVEDGEDPRDTVEWEAVEELGIRAQFHARSPPPSAPREPCPRALALQHASRPPALPRRAAAAAIRSASRILASPPVLGISPGAKKTTWRGTL
jgi:hypothetical protein